MKRVLVLGATSGIAQSVVRKLADAGSEMVLVGRSPERTEAVAADARVRGATSVRTFVADLSDIASHGALLRFVSRDFADFDSLLLTYGSMLDQNDCRNSVERSLQEWSTNFTSAAALLTLFAAYMEERRHGCIAVLTSVAGDRGRGSNYVYGSAKGALSLFLQGLRNRLYVSNVKVVTIKPGPVNTAMTWQLPHAARFASPELVARDIVKALDGGRDIVYTPWYWRYVMAVIKAIPEKVFKRLSL